MICTSAAFHPKTFYLYKMSWFFRDYSVLTGCYGRILLFHGPVRDTDAMEGLEDAPVITPLASSLFTVSVA